MFLFCSSSWPQTSTCLSVYRSRPPSCNVDMWKLVWNVLYQAFLSSLLFTFVQAGGALIEKK